jgi:uncharacterized membrane protein YhaH (DUF805 family)
MSFSEAVRTVLSKYTDFSGRARRSEYWYWSLAMFLAFVVVGVVAAASSTLGTLLEVVLFLAVLLPSLAVTVRRLHDTGRSGWMCLIGLIPLVGGIVLLVFTVSDSAPGPNQYGPAPKALAAGAPGFGYGT